MTNETKDIEKIVDKRLKALLLANSKISELPPSVALTGPELLAIVQSAETRQATMNQIRDFIELDAVSPAFAKFGFVGNATETVIATQGVPVKVAGTYVSGELQLFTHVGGTATYIGDLTRKFQVAAYTTSTMDLASGDISLFIAKQSAVITTSPQSPDLDGISPSFLPIGIGDIVTLSTGETIEIFVQNNTGTENITHKDLAVVLGAPGFTGAVVEDFSVFSQTNTVIVEDTTLETTLSGTGVGSLSFPANTLSPGDSFSFVLAGHRSIIASGPPSNEMFLKLSDGTVVFFDTGLRSVAGSTSLTPYSFKATMTVQAIGGPGVARIHTSITGNLFSANDIFYINSTTFDTTVDNNLLLTVKYNFASFQSEIQSQILTLSHI